MKQIKNSGFLYKFSEIKYLLIIFISSQISFAQTSSRFFSEAPIYFENDVRYSNQVIVHFKNKVFDLPAGKNHVIDSDIEKIPPDIKLFLKNIKSRYGGFKLIKRIEDSIWGDTLRTHLITGKLVRVHDYSQLFTIYFENFVPIDSIIEVLNQRKDVEYADPPFQAMSLIEPNDLLGGSTGNQWNLYKINAPKAWDITKGSSEVVVGMIEVGELGHNGLPDRSLNEFTNTDQSSKFHPTKGDFVSGSTSGHANMVASMIGAATNNGDGFASLGWNILIAPYRLTQLIDGTGTNTFEAAIDRAQAHGIKVINCSFITKEFVYSGSGCFIYRTKDFGSVRRGIYDALNTGITIIAATGNSIFDLIEGETCNPDEHSDRHPYPPYPASYFFEDIQKGVIGVSATTITDAFAYSDYQGQQLQYNNGSWVDFCAPGKNILNISGSGIYPVASGTSFASPQVAALVGLMKSLKSDLTTTQIEEILEATVEDLGTTGKDNYFGHGRIDAYKALKYTLENYGGTLTQSFTIPSGETWTFQDGVTLNFASGVSLTVNGTLIADGVTFTRSGASGTWGGIIFDGSSASNSILNNVDIRYAAQVQCLNSADVTIQNSRIENGTHGIYIYNAAPIIVNNTILNNTGNGIYGEANGKSPLIKNNEIKKTPSSTYQGIFLNNYTNPYITGNDIKGYLHGIYYGGGGSGYLTDEYFYTPAQNNRITYNSNGITVAWGSYLTAGIPTYPYAGGKNSIWANTTDAYAYEQGSIIGTRNWWGSDGVQTSTASGGYIDSSVPLGSDPWPASPPPKINPLVNQPVIKNNAAASAVSDGVSFSDIYKGIELETEGKIDEAVIHYKKMINNDVHAGFALSSLAKIKNKFSKGDVENYFNDLSVKNNLRKELNLIAANLLAGMHLDKGSYNEAVNIYDNIIAQSPVSYFGVNAMFEKFFAALHYKKDRNKAGKLLSEIQSLPYDYEDFLIRKEMAEFLYEGKMNNGVKDKNPVQEIADSFIPEEYALLNSYPNPFNPFTNISYHLPDAGFVTLKIFDVLGNEIATLVNGVKEQGVHSVQFNASKLSSGVYIYTVKVSGPSGNRFTASKKMILAK